MTNEFLSLARGAFAQSIDVTGATKFILRGQERSGSLNEFTEEEKMEWGQIVTNATATLEFAYERFTPPLVNGEHINYPLNGATKMLRIGRILQDEVSIKLVLQDPNE